MAARLVLVGLRSEKCRLRHCLDLAEDEPTQNKTSEERSMNTTQEELQVHVIVGADSRLPFPAEIVRA